MARIHDAGHIAWRLMGGVDVDTGLDLVWGGSRSIVAAVKNSIERMYCLDYDVLLLQNDLATSRK